MNSKLDSFLKNYFNSNSARFGFCGNFMKIDWPSFVEDGRYPHGWRLDCRDGLELQYVLSPEMPNKVKDIWRNSVFPMYKGKICLLDDNDQSKVILTTTIDPEKVDNVEMDTAFSRMTEAIFSLTSRIPSNVDQSAGDYDNESRNFFLHRHFPELFNLFNVFDDNYHNEDSFLTSEDEGTEDDTFSFSPIMGPRLNIEFSKPRPTTGMNGFSSIAGMTSLKDELSERVIWPLNHNDQARKYKVSMPSGMLLYGPPGCGKTYFAEKFAEETGMSYALVKPSDLANIYLHGSQGLISDLFEQAKKHAPCVLCFDEFDALVPKRVSTDTASQNNEVNEFLTQMNEAGKKGIFIIGTTNMKDNIDPAILRSGRLDIQVEIPAPDSLMRESLFRYHLTGRPSDSRIDFGILAGMTEGYASSDIVAIVNKAALKAAIANVEIGQKHLQDAIAKTGSSLGKITERRTMGFKSAKLPCTISV